MNNNDASTSQRDYWDSVISEVAALKGSAVESVPHDLSSDDMTVTTELRFRGIGDYPLFAYFSRPRTGGPFVPLLQVPGYGSVVVVPSVERRTRYAVMGLCHRGQRRSDSDYQAAYPGLLTDGLPCADTYVWRAVVADYLRALDVLLAQPDVDHSRLAVTGHDAAALVAGLREDIASLLVVTPLLFTGVSSRAGGTNAYPLQEINDFSRTYPSQWEEAVATLGLFDPAPLAGNIKADTMISCSAAEIPAASGISRAIPGASTIYQNTGYGFIDHKAQEDWLSNSTGVPQSPGPFLPR